MAALGRLAVVGAPDRDQAVIEVDVALAQAAQLSLAQAGVDGGGGERSPERWNVLQHARYLLDAERGVHALGHPARLRLGDRVSSDPEPRLPRLEEHGPQLCA